MPTEPSLVDTGHYLYQYSKRYIHHAMQLKHRVSEASDQKKKRDLLTTANLHLHRWKRLGLGLSAFHGFLGTKNEKLLQSLHNKHRGKRCFVIGNGPSLTMEDLERFHQQDEITIASNRIFFSFGETNWRPSYYTVADILVAEQNSEAIAGLPFTKVFPEDIKRYLSKEKEGGKSAFFSTLPPDYDEDGHYAGYFSRHFLQGVHVGETVTILNIQLAYYLGCDPIYVIGIDGTYNTSKKTENHDVYGEVFVSDGEDDNHFLKGYRKKGEAWSKPKPDFHEAGYRRCRHEIESDGRRIYNASRHSVVQAFPRIELDSLFE